MDEVEAVTGMGMMIGVVLKDKDAHEVMEKAAEKGLLILTAKEKVRLLPPLTISVEDIDKGLDILRVVLK